MEPGAEGQAEHKRKSYLRENKCLTDVKQLHFFFYVVFFLLESEGDGQAFLNAPFVNHKRTLSVSVLSLAMSYCVARINISYVLMKNSI